jgi:ceramide glucosyltransferase
VTSTLLVTAAVYIAILAFKAGAALVVVRKSRQRAEARAKADYAFVDFDRITIVQPILSGDPDLRAALCDNLRALRPACFIWLVDADDAPAQRTVTEAQQVVPEAHVRVIICAAAPDGVNPKAFKLEIALTAVRTEMFVVLDDDARMNDTALRVLCDGVTEGDLATALPYYAPAHSLGGRLLGQFVNNNAACTYLPLLPFAEPISINGMCYAARTGYMQRIGGFTPLLRHLADDLAVARTVQSHRGVIVQTIASVEVRTAVPTLKQYWQQMHRWLLFATILLRAQQLHTRAVIATLQGLHPVLLWLLTASTLASPSARHVGILVAVLCIRAVLIVAVQIATTGRPRHELLLSIASELLQPVHLAHAMLVRTIRWRTRRYRVRDNDDFTSVSASQR